MLSSLFCKNKNKNSLDATELADDVHGDNAGHEDQGADENRGRAHAKTTLIILVELEDTGLLSGQLVCHLVLLVGSGGGGTALSELVCAGVIHGEIIVVLINAR